MLFIMTIEKRRRLNLPECVCVCVRERERDRERESESGIFSYEEKETLQGTWEFVKEVLLMRVNERGREKKPFGKKVCYSIKTNINFNFLSQQKHFK